MNKYVLVFLAVFLALGLTGCDKKTTQTVTSGNSSAKVEITSMEDARKSGDKMTCTSQVTDNGKTTATTTTSIDGEKYKTVTETDGVKYYTLFDGTTFWSWDESTKNGMKMEKACMEEVSQDAQKSSPQAYEDMEATFTDGDEIDSSINVKCHADANISLAVPNDVIFTDYCAMMKDALNAFSNIGNSIPEGWGQ